ncbi:maintenance of mitochondrial morphology protein 1 [Flagelloscypha sp. PMI_526]|nr:maintenance of mitochondrial morphology protein 1 [Flagelloscypha sp. PMI_526]
MTTSSGNYIFTLHPTFTQGLVLGQLSIVVLLYFILKYLFLDSTESPVDSSSYHPVIDHEAAWKRQNAAKLQNTSANLAAKTPESAEWFNALLDQVISIYRSRLCDGLSGSEGEEVARIRIENYANKIRPPGFLDQIKVHSVSLGISAPRVSNARVHPQSSSSPKGTQLDIEYMDDISISLSTSYLFNYPMASFARLPISLTIGLATFRASRYQCTLSPDFTLSLSTESLMGSRAKLANIPKLHELIQHQVRRILANRATLGWKIPLPGLVGIAQVKEELVKEMKEEASL